MEGVTVGSVEIIALLDAPFLQNPKFVVPDHGDEMADEFRDTLDERGLAMGAVTCYLVRTGGQLILVDTGIGPRKRPGFPSGHLDEELAKAGVSPCGHHRGRAHPPPHRPRRLEYVRDSRRRQRGLLPERHLRYPAG